MNIWKLFTVGFLTVLLLLPSCKGDDILINTDNSDDNRIVGIALPAINFTFSISDAIKEMDDDRLYADENGLLHFRSTQDVSIPWEDLASLKEVDESWSYAMSDLLNINPAPPLKASGNISFQEKVKFNDTDDVRYDNATFENGEMELFINVPPAFTGEIAISIPETSPQITISFNPDGFNNSYSETISLKDRRIDFSHGTDSSYITLIIDSELSFSGIPVGSLDVGFKLKDLKTEMLEGYFGQKHSDIEEHVQELDGMGEVKDLASFEFKEVALTLNIKNPIGVPFNIQATNINFIKTVDGNPQDNLLLVDGVSKVELNVDPATIGPPIAYASNDVVISSNNSNVMDVSNPFPEKITFDVFSTANPNGEIVGQPNFIGHLDSLYAELLIEAPIWLRVSEYTRSDTLNFDFKDMMDQDRDNADLIETFAMHLDFKNKLPFELKANLFVADEEGNKIEDIWTGFESLLAVGQLDNGKISTPGETNVIVNLNKEQVLKFFDQKAMFLMIETQSSTYKKGTEFIKIFDDAGMEVSISFEVSGRIPSL